MPTEQDLGPRPTLKQSLDQLTTARARYQQAARRESKWFKLLGERIDQKLVLYRMFGVLPGGAEETTTLIQGMREQHLIERVRQAGRRAEGDMRNACKTLRTLVIRLSPGGNEKDNLELFDRLSLDPGTNFDEIIALVTRLTEPKGTIDPETAVPLLTALSHSLKAALAKFSVPTSASDATPPAVQQPVAIAPAAVAPESDSGHMAPKKRKRGPDADLVRHERIAALVKEIESRGEDWKDEAGLEAICERLDHPLKTETGAEPIPVPDPWANWQPPAPRSWSRALGYRPRLVMQAIQYSLKWRAKQR